MRRLLLASVAWALCTGSLLADGEISSMTINPLPIPVGTIVTYGTTISGNPPMFGYTWEWRCTEFPPGVGNWQQFANTAGVQILENRIGSQEVNVIGQFVGHVHNQARSIDVLSPTSISVVINNPSTPFVPPQSQMRVTVVYPVFCGSQSMGKDGVNGYAERKLRRPQFNEDSGWVAQTPSTFFLIKDTIEEYHDIVMTESEWESIAEDEVLDDFYVQFRLVIRTCHGDDRWFTFPELHYRKVKVSESTWALQQLQ